MINRRDELLKAKRIFQELVDFSSLEGNLTQQIVEEKLSDTKEVLSKLIDIDDDLFHELVKVIHSEFIIIQNEGQVISDDSHSSWYKGNENQYNSVYWSRYKNFLIQEKNFPILTVKNLERDLNNIVDLLGNPNVNVNFARRGLVIGDVQSGKTSNYIGLLSKAVDAGYKVVILLTGTIEKLRQQTQIRVEEGFIGYDSFNQKRIGVGRVDGELNIATPLSMTSRVSDFTGKLDHNTVLSLNDKSQPFVFVIKKNTTVLSKLFEALKNINTSNRSNSINQSLLMIDDESDNASINTNDPENDPTRTNKLIRQLLNLFDKSTYVGFTATPFANVFIDPTTEDEMLKADLFPEHFIYALDSPSNYFGANKVFIDSDKNLRIIDDVEEHIFSYRHKKDWNGNRLFNSLNKAIYAFLLTNVIRDLRGHDTSHRTMMINVSRFVNVQSRVTEIVRYIVEGLLRSIRQQAHRDPSISLSNDDIKAIYDNWKEEYADLATWDEVKENIYKSNENIEIIEVNSSKKSIVKLDYENSPGGLRVIAVGGSVLSRGLTLEGLTVSYFYRNTSTYDVLMQMGRWFGYRPGYEDLCRVWISQESANWYRDIAEATTELKQDMKFMKELGKKPKEFGIRVRNDSSDLIITSRNKSRATKQVTDYGSFYGGYFEAPYVLSDIQALRSNYNSWVQFITKIASKHTSSHPNIFKEVSVGLVVEFLRSLRLPNSYRFDVKQITEFIEPRMMTPELCLFDVVIVEGFSKESKIYNKHNVAGFEHYLVERIFNVLDGDKIRISGNKARLSGKTDARFGLTPEEIKSVESQRFTDNKGVKSQSYLIKGRRPILLIYPLRLKEPSNQDEKGIYHRIVEDGVVPVSVALGFPRTDQVHEPQTSKYTVNKIYDYFDLNPIQDVEDFDDEDL
jgi:hypothetical protein